MHSRLWRRHGFECRRQQRHIFCCFFLVKKILKDAILLIGWELLWLPSLKPVAVSSLSYFLPIKWGPKAAFLCACLYLQFSSASLLFRLFFSLHYRKAPMTGWAKINAMSYLPAQAIMPKMPWKCPNCLPFSAIWNCRAFWAFMAFIRAFSANIRHLWYFCGFLNIKAMWSRIPAA